HELFRQQPLVQDNRPPLWCLNEQMEQLDAKKLGWNATGLLPSVDYYDNGGKQLEDMLNLFDNNLDMSVTIAGWPNNCPATMAETITFDDIEQLCIRMAEHALDINGEQCAGTLATRALSRTICHNLIALLIHLQTIQSIPDRPGPLLIPCNSLQLDASQHSVFLIHD